ncbi:MAG: DUF3102 domain-containing protein [Proteobacteria bacterium]|nr:DUF3102 domain-containing protein [Pseudomonadota bacterium]
MNTELIIIADDINKQHQLSIKSAKTAIEYAHKTGELLTEAKLYVKHGEWNDWILNNCQFSTRTARAYMQLSKRQLSADLTIDQTLALMVTPKVRDTARSGQAMFSLAAGLTAGASALSNQDVGALGSLPNDGT